MEVLENIKIVFIDLDGTLLNDKKRISLKTRCSIKKLVSKGVYVVVASGRNCKFSVDKSRKALASKIVISSNGAEIYDYHKKNALFNSYIEFSKLEDIWNYCNKHEIGVIFNSISGIYINKYLIDNYDYKTKLLTSVKELKKLDVSQMVISVNNYGKILKMEDYIKKIGLDVAYFSKSYDYTMVAHKCSLDAINEGVSKGSAIEKLLEILDIKKEESLCFGDYINDLDMFDACGYKVAMENACDELKDKADFVTLSNNNNGVAYFIDNYLL